MPELAYKLNYESAKMARKVADKVINIIIK